MGRGKGHRWALAISAELTSCLPCMSNKLGNDGPRSQILDRMNVKATILQPVPIHSISNTSQARKSCGPPLTATPSIVSSGWGSHARETVTSV